MKSILLSDISVNGAIAIIPARGGSKGLPRKNVLSLAGKPLIAHVIAAALAARHVGRVVVTTDDAEIAEVSRRFGAEIVMRPVALASDTASSEDALLHAIDTLYPSGTRPPDILIFLQCTSPLTTAADIDRVVETLVREEADCAFAATRFHHFLWRAHEPGDFHGVNHDRAVRQMRQQRPPEFLETGAAYAMRIDGFRVARHRFFGRVTASEMPTERVGEIDTAEEFAIIDARMAAARRGTAALPTDPSALIMDFDGVFTDDLVLVDQDGREAVMCSRSDGMGIELLRKSGLPMIVLSKETNPVVRARCAKLKLECVHGLETKLDTMIDWATRGGIDLSRAIYVGNDINDIACLDRVGCAVVPRDGHPAALAHADIVIDADGGRGALRRLADMILSAPPASAAQAIGDDPVGRRAVG